MKRNFLAYILLCILCLGNTACQDDLLYNGGEIGEGESLVSATVKFKNLTPALEADTRTAGDAIKQIQSLHVVVYNDKGELQKIYKLKKAEGDTPGEGEYTLTDKDRKDDTNTETIGGEKQDLPSAETQTPHADFKLRIPYGRYMIYAVANIADLDTNKNYAENIKTADGLKSISLQWNKEEIANNNQMFGHFTVTGSAQNDEVAVINQATTKLHAWIRRAASKVTIAYDGSTLHENVYIYLKSVTIKDIPTVCYLGKENTITRKNEESEGYGGLIEEGKSITYATGKNYDEHWPARITKGKPYYYYTDKEGVSVPNNDYNTDEQKKEKAVLAHAEKNQALFFYENMQGTGKDKRQDATGPDGTGEPDGALDAPGLPGNETYIAKDNKPYGTYIEVKAYYVSNAEGRVGNGDITYRFMLGKDIYKDYNAERNHHYKLTLKFNKYANDVDWHIEYKEEKPGIEAPNPYYISYLYNRTMNLPIKINTGGGTLTDLKAEIITNNWAPKDAYTGNADQLDYAYWYDYDVTSQDGFSYGSHPNGNTNQPWNGFLSLRKTKYKILTNISEESSEGVHYIVNNQNYYNTEQIGTRTYLQDKKEFENNEEDGKFTITSNENEHTVNITIPFYTRAKQMIITTGYTGNNPYVAYQRRATVKLTATLQMPGGKSKELTENVEILQVRRLVNPKGIYRKHDNDKSFHVKLLRLPRENATNFVEFTSEGPWRAEVVEGSTSNFIDLNGQPQVEGNTGTPIDFIVNFKGTCRENENRYAVIRVNYHNYTCQHLIFVRQGDAPDALLDDGAKWHAHNLVTASSEATSPLDEGSLFKLGNMANPIAASNQKYEKEWINVEPSFFPSHTATYNPSLKIAGTDSEMQWSAIPTIAPDILEDGKTMWQYEKNTQSTPKEVGKFSLKGARIAEYEDFRALFLSDKIEQGYGVLYGNDATETATTISGAYQYGAGSKTAGMRGCFVYNKETCKNLFFPIGASGYGHRKRYDALNPSDATSMGILRYSSDRYDKYPENGSQPGETLKEKPLFYDLYMRPGAIYWFDKQATVKGGKSLGWDINYFTFDFNYISKMKVSSNIWHNDACFIRCVED